MRFSDSAIFEISSYTRVTPAIFAIVTHPFSDFVRPHCSYPAIFYFSIITEIWSAIYQAT
jgi:hypothetical protein